MIRLIHIAILMPPNSLNLAVPTSPSGALATEGFSVYRVVKWQEGFVGRRPTLVSGALATEGFSVYRVVVWPEGFVGRRPTSVSGGLATEGFSVYRVVEWPEGLVRRRATLVSGGLATEVFLFIGWFNGRRASSGDARLWSPGV